MRIAFGIFATQSYIMADDEIYYVTDATSRAFREYLEEDLSDDEFHRRDEEYNAKERYDRELIECPFCHQGYLPRNCVEMMQMPRIDGWTSFHDHLGHSQKESE